MLVDGLIYLLIFIILWVSVVLESSKKVSRMGKILFTFSSIMLSLFIGFRWETGTDWDSYKTLFDTIELDWSFLLNVYHFDIGYVLFNALVRIFTDNYTIFLCVNSIVTIYFLSKLIIKVSPYPNLSLFFFYTNFMIAQFMGSNRRMMAMVFVLWGFYYAYLYNKKKGLISIGSAFLFHRASIVSILSWFVPKKIWGIKKTIAILLASLCIGLVQLPAKMIELSGHILGAITSNPLVEKMIFYSENNEDHLVYGTGSLILSTILAVGKRSILLAFYLYIASRKKIDGLTQFFYNLYIVSFAGYLLFIGSFFQMLTAFFAFVEVLLIGRMYSYTSGKAKMAFCTLVFAYGILQMMNALNVYPELYIPYLPFWTDISR